MRDERVYPPHLRERGTPTAEEARQAPAKRQCLVESSLSGLPFKFKLVPGGFIACQ
jgi:hypothetical protein